MKLILLSCFTIAILQLTCCHAESEDPPYDTHTVGGKTVYVSREKMEWMYASDDCRKYGLHLVSVKSAEENSAIQELIKDFDDDVWIGGYRLSQLFSGNPEWLWNSDTSKMDWTNWSEGEPKFVDDGDLTDIYCTLMNRATGRWTSECFSTKATFLCSK